jgi:hypothetical protein
VLGTGALVALLLPFRTPRAADVALSAAAERQSDLPAQELPIVEAPLPVFAGGSA